MRETPQNIDRSVKVLEYAMAFLIPAFLTIPIIQLWSIPVGIVTCALTIKYTAGKPPGFAEETIYRCGMQLREMMPRKLKRLDH